MFFCGFGVTKELKEFTTQRMYCAYKLKGLPP
jgi:hypothetical protein